MHRPHVMDARLPRPRVDSLVRRREAQEAGKMPAVRGTVLVTALTPPLTHGSVSAPQGDALSEPSLNRNLLRASGLPSQSAIGTA
jgi:hypothetical protein